MLSPGIACAVFALQMLAMGADEFHFHRKRGLPRWERIGHPLDTLTVLACLTWLLLKPADSFSIPVYVGLSIVSCLFITKDEGIHHRCCPAAEQWLHALLFILHPLVLLSAGLLWPAVHEPAPASRVLFDGGDARSLLLGYVALASLFGLYQLVYWNLIWRPRSQAIQ